MVKKIVVIGAVSQGGVFGEEGKIPWHISEDFRHFQKTTMGHTVAMGRKTWESLPPKFRPLPGRQKVVISNSVTSLEGAEIARSVEHVIQIAKSSEVFFIGGIDVWYHAMHFADEAIISVVRRDYPIGEETRLAPELLSPPKRWTEFYLREIIRLEKTSADNPGVDVHYWVRS